MFHVHGVEVDPNAVPVREPALVVEAVRPPQPDSERAVAEDDVPTRSPDQARDVRRVLRPHRAVGGPGSYTRTRSRPCLRCTSPPVCSTASPPRPRPGPWVAAPQGLGRGPEGGLTT